MVVLLWSVLEREYVSLMLLHERRRSRRRSRRRRRCLRSPPAPRPSCPRTDRRRLRRRPAKMMRRPSSQVVQAKSSTCPFLNTARSQQKRTLRSAVLQQALSPLRCISLSLSFSLCKRLIYISLFKLHRVANSIVTRWRSCDGRFLLQFAPLWWLSG